MNHKKHIVLFLCVLLGACAGILGIKPRNGERPFEHRAHVTKGVACTVCHEGIAKEVRTGPLHLPTTATCVSCHAKPHTQQSCGDCHGEKHQRQEVEIAKHALRFEHAKHVVASNGSCTKCHAKIGESRDVSLMPPMVSCFACHQHEKQFAARDCNGCHVDLPAEHVTPQDHLVHDGDFIREHGVRAAASPDLCATCHSERTCLSCHGVGTTPALPARLTFDQPRLSGLHRAGFLSRHAEESKNNPGLCTTCHAENTCRSCHEQQNVSAGGPTKRRSPHPSTWLNPTRGGDHGQAARLDPAGCAGCHGGAGEQLCIGCHKVGGPGGNPHGPGYTSRKDKQNDVPCRFCHRMGS